MKCCFCQQEIVKENFTREQWNHKLAYYRNTGRIYCSKNCSQKFVVGNLNEYMKSEKGHVRMKTQNPMYKEEVRKKVSTTLKNINHKPSVRGGNGKGMTVPQSLLKTELEKKGLDVFSEYPIPTKIPKVHGYPT